MIRALLLAGALLGSGMTTEGVVRGTVRSAGSLEPVPYAQVRVPELDRLVVADAQGFYVLSDLPPGRWTVEAAAMGHDTVALIVVASGAGSVLLDFELPLRPVELPGVAGRGAGRVPALMSDDPSPTVGPPTVRLQGPALRAVPGLAEADVLRALQVLPSIAATSDFSSALYVRGGSSDQTLITLDGVPLFNPYHLGGIFSAISAEAVSSVEVWPGAMPASAGDRLSGAVDIRTRDGARDRTRWAGAVGLISANLGFEGPLPWGGGSYLFAGRRTYLDAATGAAHALGLIPASMPYGFSDVHLKLSHDVGLLGTLTLSGYLNSENVHFSPGTAEQFRADADFDWGSRMLAATFRRPLGSSFLFEARAAWSDFVGDFHGWAIRPEGPIGGVEPGELPDVPTDTTKTVEAETVARDLIGSLKLTWYGRSHTAHVGIQVDDYRFAGRLGLAERLNEQYFPTFDMGEEPRTLAAFVEDEWRLADPLSLRFGLRYLDAGEIGSAWLPRFGARLQLSSRLALTAGGGAYAQVLRSFKDDESLASSLIAYDLLTAQPATAGLARSRDVVLALEWRDDATRLRIDAFAKQMRGLVLAPEPQDPLLAFPLVVDSFRVGEGRARGVELMTGHRFGQVEVAATYALSLTERVVGEDRYTPRFERRHMLDVNVAAPVGRRGLLTARLALGSGQPHTPVVGRAVPFGWTPWGDGWMEDRTTALLGEHNSARLPGYMRIDAAYRSEIERNWFGRDVTLSPYIQVLNLLNNSNVLIAAPQFERLEYWPQLPVLPTLGVEWRF